MRTAIKLILLNLLIAQIIAPILVMIPCVIYLVATTGNLYNVEFLRNADNRTSYDSAVYTESLIKAIEIIERSGGQTIDTSYIVMDENGEIAYDWRISGVESSEAIERVRRIRYKNFCEAMYISIKDPSN